MARTFSSGNYLSAGSPIGSAISTHTVSVWVRCTNSGAGIKTIFEISEGSSTTSYHRLYMDTLTPRYAAHGASGVERVASAAGAATVDTWAHILYYRSGTGTARLLLNGTGGTTQSNNITAPSGLDTSVIGARADASNYFIGDICELAVWDAAITLADEQAGLANGVCPFLVRPASLVLYVPVWGISSPENEWLGALGGYTLTGSPAVADHAPNSTRPGARQFVFISAAAQAQVSPNDASHGHTVDNLSLTQVHTLVTAEALHGHAVDNVTLSQVHALSIAEALHGHAVDNATLTEIANLASADALHGHTADNVTLSQVHALAPAEASHAHLADNVVLSQVHALALADALHTHTVDNLTLSQSQALAVAEALHGHTVDEVGLTQVHALAVAEALHAHAADSATLSQVHTLSVADTLHGHAVDNVTLTTEYIVSILEALHGHTVTEVGLTQAHLLGIDEAVHGHTAEAVGLTQAHLLAIQDTLHALVDSGATVESGVVLSVLDALHGHTVDAVTVTQVHSLTIIEAIHGHTSDSVVLFEEGGTLVRQCCGVARIQLAR